MIVFLKKYWLTILGVPVGALGDYIYYFNWGCEDACPIRSSSVKMMLYGMLMGGLLFNIIEGEIKKRRN